jgi:hypothetical protein
MHGVNYDIAGFASAATKNSSRRKGLFVRIFHAVQQSRMQQARRVIAEHAHLLPKR